MATEEQKDQLQDMIFGFDRATDESSLGLLLRRVADPEMTDLLIPRLEDTEINAILDLFSGLMKKHLRKEEYHRFFLKEK